MIKERTRHWIQVLSGIACNGYIYGFQKGKIFQGGTKLFCVPVLNCYSCPGAVAACPIGSLQAVLGDRKYQFSFYVLGTLMLFSILIGRIACGFLCPFGFVQDLLYKLPAPKLHIPQKPDQMLRCLKYGILLFFVIAAPIFLTNAFGMGSPYFCKFICPAGALEGGVPLVLSNPTLRKTIGILFYWKAGILMIIVIGSCFIYRPFCKYICPLGAFYAVFHKFSLYQVKVDQKKCIKCGMCERICKMQVRLTENKNGAECIRCGECKTVCPENAVYFERPGRSAAIAPSEIREEKNEKKSKCIHKKNYSEKWR